MRKTTHGLYGIALRYGSCKDKPTGDIGESASSQVSRHLQLGTLHNRCVDISIGSPFSRDEIKVYEVARARICSYVGAAVAGNLPIQTLRALAN